MKKCNNAGSGIRTHEELSHWISHQRLHESTEIVFFRS